MECQIEILRRCFPPSIRLILHELPRTLDETYERIMMGIDKEKQPYTNRLFQCLAMAIRPLFVEELAGLFAILPNPESTPEFNIDWRPEDPEEFILSACSTLVTIVKTRHGKVVQFAHFSVREYLTSDRIGNSASASHFHILPKLAHTLLARACLSVLLQLDHSNYVARSQDFPLALYAAKHWVNHARFENVSSNIKDEMDYLFDRNKPHLDAWVSLSGIRYNPLACRHPHPLQPDAETVFYAALYGFRDLAERLLNAHPLESNARGLSYAIPLHEALLNGHLDVVLLLLDRGADAGYYDGFRRNALYYASSRGYADVVPSLVKHGANLHVASEEEKSFLPVTPLQVASKRGRLKMVRVLLECGANRNDAVSLCIAARHPSNDFNLTRLLLAHGANPNTVAYGAEDVRTALQVASSHGRVTVVILLLEHGANVHAQDPYGYTPLHEAAKEGHPKAVELLLQSGSDANVQKKDGWTALHLAAPRGHLRVVETLLEHGADPHAQTNDGKTPFQLAKNPCSRVSEHTQMEIMQLLSEHTGEGIEDLEIYDMDPYDEDPGNGYSD